MGKSEKLSVSESLTLDVIRVAAAIVVAIGHITLVSFSSGLPNLIPVGRGAVIVFFVLSGFVIRYVTVRRPATMTDFFRDRASRVYSVAIPAMLITIAADSIARRVNPAFYAALDMTQAPRIIGVVSNLIWTAYIWTRFDDVASNSPFWSLNYEVIYYVLYACGFYLAGKRRWVWLAVVCLIAGPKILLLFPTWLLGCYAHDLYQRWHGDRRLTVTLNYACVFFAVIIGALVIDRKLGDAAMAFYMVFLREGRKLKLGRTSGVIDFYAAGLACTVFLLRLLVAVRGVRVDAKGVLARWIPVVAEGTFTIYLTHFPLFILIAATVPYDHSSLWQLAVLLSTVVAFGVVAGQFCKSLKMRLRSMLA